MQPEELDAWFDANRRLLETAYLEGREPWQQSGFGLHRPKTPAHWEAQRRPIADCIERSSTFLDVGCANGFLCESVVRWCAARSVAVEPFGLDLSERLVALARERVPGAADHFFAGNAWDWTPPRRFDYVRIELVYVPDALHGEYARRLLDWLEPDGALLGAEYRAGRDDIRPALDVDDRLRALGFVVEAVHSGWWEDVEQTRVAVVRRRD